MGIGHKPLAIMKLTSDYSDFFMQNEPIYERPVVKRGGADFVSQGSRTSPSPSASVDLAHLRVCSKSPMLWSVSVVACTETDPGTSPRSADEASTESC